MGLLVVVGGFRSDIRGLGFRSYPQKYLQTPPYIGNPLRASNHQEDWWGGSKGWLCLRTPSSLARLFSIGGLGTSLFFGRTKDWPLCTLHLQIPIQYRGVGHNSGSCTSAWTWRSRAWKQRWRSVSASLNHGGLGIFRFQFTGRGARQFAAWKRREVQP